MSKPKPYVGLLGAMILACCLAVGAISLGIAGRDAQNDLYPTAIVEVIPAPTLTPSLEPTLTPVAQQSSIDSPYESPFGEQIFIGESVQIYGTQGDGLRLRASPGLDGKILFLAFEGEIFRVEDGPEEASGYIWWYLVAPYDENIYGWAVQNYLKIVKSQE